jgi:hypothetical protein
MFSDAPAGYLRADDPTIEYDRIIYNAIFTKLINDNWITNESGDASTTFNIPDFRGCFLRGYGENSATLGVKQLDSAPNITGFVGGWVGLNGGRYSASGAFQTNLANYGQYTDSRNDVCTGNSFDASRSSASYGRNNTTEVRPINYAIYYYIKY